MISDLCDVPGVTRKELGNQNLASVKSFII